MRGRLGARLAIAAREGHLGGVCRAVAGEMERIARDAGAEFVLVRDIPYARRSGDSRVHRRGFQPLMGFPIAMMTVRWPSFEGYLDALKCATRKRIRRFLSRPAPGSRRR